MSLKRETDANLDLRKPEKKHTAPKSILAAEGRTNVLLVLEAETSIVDEIVAFMPKVLLNIIYGYTQEILVNFGERRLRDIPGVKFPRKLHPRCDNPDGRLSRDYIVLEEHRVKRPRLHKSSCDRCSNGQCRTCYLCTTFVHEVNGLNWVRKSELRETPYEIFTRARWLEREEDKQSPDYTVLCDDCDLELMMDVCIPPDIPAHCDECIEQAVGFCWIGGYILPACARHLYWVDSWRQECYCPACVPSAPKRTKKRRRSQNQAKGER